MLNLLKLVMRRLLFASGVAVVLLLLAVAIVSALVEKAPEYAGPLPALLAKRTVTGPVTRVRDGDTIEVGGVAIRLGSLDCAERGSTRGDKATYRMRSLISGETLACYLNGRISYDC